MGRTDLVVVALPSQDDRVRKISSEKEPHLTLLYLKDVYNLEQLELVTRHVQFAASQICKFGMDVVERGELGDKNADVLFFNKKWSKEIEAFRSNLLRNDLIMTGYQSTDQFPEWTPHLTLGYPDSPAKKDVLDFGYVRFDRIALWTENYDGPTFKLKDKDYDTEVAMSLIESDHSVVESVLSHAEADFDLEEEYGDLLDLISSYIDEMGEVTHYGVKGMKWGVRKSETKTPREQLKSLGPDSVSRKTASGETITLQKIPPNKIHNFLGRISKGYRDDYSNQAMLNILDSSGKKVGNANVTKKNDDELYLEWLGINKSARGKGYATAVMKAGRDFGKQQGFKRMTLEVPGNSPDARHIYEKLGFKVTKEAESTDDFWGGLTEMAYEFDTAQSALTHYGVKGMKWGVRRAEPTSGSARRSPRSEDAKAFERNARKIEMHGTSSLSNKELQSVLTRMNMENQYHNLSADHRNHLDEGHQQVKKILAYGETIEKARKFLETPTGQAVKTGVKASAAAAFGYFTGGAGPATVAGAGVVVRRMTR